MIPDDDGLIGISLGGAGVRKNHKALLELSRYGVLDVIELIVSTLPMILYSPALYLG